MSYSEKGYVPVEEYVIPLGQADIKRPGTDVTIVATSSMVPVSLAAADTLAQHGIEAEVIDPRTLTPLDEKTIINSTIKTGRAVVVDEGCRRFGVTAEIGSLIAEGAFDYLQAPVRRIGALDVPLPYTYSLESVTIPTSQQITDGVLALMDR
jgi:pyruvate dehydrogenase E1 component beta subunit